MKFDAKTNGKKSRYSVDEGEDKDDDGDYSFPTVYHKLDFDTAENGKFTAIKRTKSYVANVADPEYTGPVNATNYHQASALILQKRARGMIGRVKAKQAAEAKQAMKRARDRQKKLKQ